MTHLLPKAANIVTFVTFIAAGMCGAGASACDSNTCGRPSAVPITNSSIFLAQALTPTMPDGKASAERVVWVAPSRERPALSRGNLIFVAEKEAFQGCTMSQIQSMKGSICLDKYNNDINYKAALWHTIVCRGTEIVCCLSDDHGKISKCEAVGAMAPPKPEVVCSALKSAKGVWTPDPKSIKANSGGKTCTQNYICGPPSPKELSESQNKCTAVVSVSNKQVTMTGTCVPESKSGTCSSCLGNPPNDPCVVSFRK